MPFKKDITDFIDILTLEASMGNDVELLAKQYDNFYPLSESIVFVENIIQGETAKDISTLVLRFAKDQVIETKAYIEPELKGTIISVIGYFNGLYYRCCGGLMPVISKARDVKFFNVTRAYRMGPVTGLSELSVAQNYTYSFDIKPLGSTGLYYKVIAHPKPPKPINKIINMEIENCVTTINTSAYADTEEDTSGDDYPDLPDEATAEAEASQED